MRGLRTMVLVLSTVWLATLPSPASAETRVAGRIETDTTWTQAGSPYILETTVEISHGATLTIEPGVQVMGEPSTGLTVYGNLMAVGTAEQPIEFTSVLWRSSSWNDQWRGIETWWDPTSADVSGRATINHAIIGDSQESGLYAGASVSVTNTTFQYNLTGMSFFPPVYATSPTVSDNTFLYNEWGLYVLSAYGTTVLIQDNDFYNNRTAIDLYGPAAIHANDIVRSPGYNFWDGDLIVERCGNGYNCPDYTVDAEGNWWNTTKQGQIASRVLDGADDPERGTVDWNPSSTTPNTSWPPPPKAHARSVTLALSGSLRASGRVEVEDSFKPCRSGVHVAIQMKSSNGWRTIELVKTTAKGSFSASIPNRAAKYRAMALEEQIDAPPTDLCRVATSGVTAAT